VSRADSGKADHGAAGVGSAVVVGPGDVVDVAADDGVVDAGSVGRVTGAASPSPPPPQLTRAMRANMSAGNRRGDTLRRIPSLRTP